MAGGTERIPILYLAPWVDYGGTDKGTLDWFRWLDRDRFAPSLITTQPSPNRRLSEVEPFAEEVWALPDLMPAEHMPRFILDFLHSRQVRVVHLMNSRMSFDLLPDIGCLPDPPSVVVQLHVEEADRSGYVRYVTTRYGNLVDRFSVSSNHLAEAVDGYGVPRDKIDVIYTGVDAEQEFSPERVKPIGELPDDRLQILYPARLVDQKDPLLMVEVAAGLRDRGVKFQVHAVGEGDLERTVTERAAALELGDRIEIHPPTSEPERWYAACDAVLLTSVFEGVPYVVFEAMAMGLPVVSPALPGNVELLGADDDGLVEPRDSIEQYVSALSRLAEDEGHRKAHGSRLRERARAKFSLRQMAGAHEAVYEELVAGRRPIRAGNNGKRQLPEPIQLQRRPQDGTPLVSVLIPHFNQVRFLRECVNSIRAQSYPEIEMVVVDDASAEAGTAAALAELEEDSNLTVVRMAENGGPSHARNAGLEHCSGRYIYPVDADNVLLPDAVANLVAQLGEAAEDIGFIYPNLQFFGNREDYHEVPDFDVYTLLHGNFCDTCSLLDRGIFDAGERYREDIRLGHEDWEFVLRLAARGVRGEAARMPTVRYRKWGFNRSDLVEHGSERFDELLAEISPFRGLEKEVKEIESPALSIFPFAEPEQDAANIRAVGDRLAAQTCTDIELLARFDAGSLKDDDLRRIRRLSRKPVAEAAQEALALARGAFVAITSGRAADLIADPSLCEKLLRRFVLAGDELDAIALVDAGTAGRFHFRALPADEVPTDWAPHTIVWRRTAELDLPAGLLADPADAVTSIIRLLSGAGLGVEWRHVPGPRARVKDGRSPQRDWIELPPSRNSIEDPHGLHPGAQPLLPADDEYRVPRWDDTPTWVPPLCAIVVRYKERHSERRLVTTGPAPPGFVPEIPLGAVRTVSFEGTAKVIHVDNDYVAVPAGSAHLAPGTGSEIGYVELAGFPQLDTLAVATHRRTRQRVLIALPDDPLQLEVEAIEPIGHVEPYPARPRSAPPAWGRSLGLLGLTRTVDPSSRRHRYGIAHVPNGELLCELGALAESDMQGSIGAWIENGYLVTELHSPPVQKPPFSEARSWVVEPAAWRGMATRSQRAKVAGRRAATAAIRLLQPAHHVRNSRGKPEGWLFDSERVGRTPLFAAYHPVTGDQLLVRSPQDAAQLGYGAPELLGYMRNAAPVTGQVALRPVAIPWATRFGNVPLAG